MENKAIVTYCRLTNGEIKAFSDNLAEVTKNYDAAHQYCEHLANYPGTMNVEWTKTLEEIGKPMYAFQKNTLDGVFKIIPGKDVAIIDNHGCAVEVYPEDGDMIFATKEDAILAMHTLKDEHLTEHINNLINKRACLREEVRALSAQIDEAVAERNSLFK